MDICLDCRVLTPHFPGIGRYTAALLEALPALLEAGERLVLVCDPRSAARLPPSSPCDPSGSAALLARLPAAPASRAAALDPIVRLNAGASPFSLSQQWRVRRALRGARGIYHAPCHLMAYRSGLPSVVTICDLIPVRAPAGLSLRARLVFRALVRSALRSSAAAIAISESTRRDLLAFAPIEADRVVAIPLAADRRFVPPSARDKDQARARYDLPARYALYVGINKPHKNLTRLVEAWARLAGSRGGERGLVIAGPWDRRYPEARRAVERLGVSGSVRFLGRVDDADLPALYGGAQAFVFPSLYEGFGLPVLEAMACGAPVACSNRSSLPEVAGDAALLFDPGDVGQIAAALARLFDDLPLAHTLAARGLERSRIFSWERTARATLALYRRIGS